MSTGVVAVAAGGRQRGVQRVGISNQLVCVHRPSRAIVVKLSANRTSGFSTDEGTNRDLEDVAFLRGIARSLG